MLNATRALCAAIMLAMVAIAGPAHAQEGAWRIGKMSGEVFVTNAGVEYGNVAADMALKPGDTVRTGANGRMLLTRGEESILISPNTVIALPNQYRNRGTTTIVQRAGSILLEVEKRNVKHFEVETPYLAAVVKGTQFRVSVEKTDAKVEVYKGLVEVVALKSGDVGQVQPGQSATVPAQGAAKISLSGSGTLAPVQQGTPRRASVEPLTAAEQDAAAQMTTAQNQQNARQGAQGEGVTSLGDGAAGRIDAANASSASRRARNTPSNWTIGGFDIQSWVSNNEGLASALMFPVAIGFFVAAGVATQRRWRKRKMAR